jgi:NAD(P)-dependent dehydrogenase (short-subunit alcohol dehydrogenase family)
MAGRLQDKVCIVTGAARNLGQAYAVRLAEEGAKVTACDVLDCSETAAKIEELGGEVLPLRIDVSDEAQTLELAHKTFDRFGRIDCLLNNAARFRNLGPNTIETMDMKIWDEVFAVNVRGTFLCIRAVLPYMRQQRGGKIINISSGTWTHTSRTPDTSNTHYVASKAAVMGLTRSVTRELGQYNIRVNTLAPGSTAVGDEALNLENLSDPERALLRRGRPTDLTGPVVFLFSDDSDFVSGQMLLVNGGMETW